MANVFGGGPGPDSVYDRLGEYDEMYGNEGNDDLATEKNGQVILDGGSGDDHLEFVWYGGSWGRLIGGGGNDKIEGGVSPNGDWLEGGAGDDYLYADDGADLLDGGDGRDELVGSDGNDTLYGGEGDDSGINITVGPRGDWAYPGLYGGWGDDSIDGGNGDDYLDGYEGSDTLIGGSGVDTMEGGDGDDTYVVDSCSSWNLIGQSVSGDRSGSPA
jgi:Ca2+-binding RTX toxin-like protein